MVNVPPGSNKLDLTFGSSVFNEPILDSAPFSCTLASTSITCNTGGVGGMVFLRLHIQDFAPPGSAEVVATLDDTPTLSTTLSVVISEPPIVELRQADVDGNLNAALHEQQARENLIVGARVAACFVTPEGQPASVPLLSPTDIMTVSSGGYRVSGDESPNMVDVQYFLSTAGGTCFSWVSTGAGDQDVHAQVGWRTTGWDQSGAPLMFGWNRLEVMTISAAPSTQPVPSPVSATAAVDNPAGLTIHVALSPSGYPPINVGLRLTGSHVNASGEPVEIAPPNSLVGVSWSAQQSEAGTCNAGFPVNGSVLSDDGSAFLISPPQICAQATSFDVTVTANEPGPLGSGPGRSVTAVIHVVLDAPVPAPKSILLAWAGQRVILETDYRSLRGDLGVPPNPQGTCAYEQEFQVRYLREDGPGNFIPALGATLGVPDEATITVSPSNSQVVSQFPSAPQASCISRVLYESEDQGEVDIESFVESVGGAFPDNPRKSTFVVYYMKINHVALSLPHARKSQVNATGTDYASGVNSGNPWDVATDTPSVTANLARDTLVRGRVSGWFVNATPSGRQRDDSNPSNILPADRWVVPDDWSIIAGAPFRPNYDIMIAPNNSYGYGCASPTGPCTDATTANDGLDFVYGPFSLLDVPGVVSGAISPSPLFRPDNSILEDGAVDWWDAPMPPTLVSVSLRGTGFLKQVLKQDVYYTGQADQESTQRYPNPFYEAAIPASPFIPAMVVGGQSAWDTWGNDGPGGTGKGPYTFWTAIPSFLSGSGYAADGASDTSLTSAELDAISQLRQSASDPSIARDLVIYSDNHGEFMVAANGAFRAGPSTAEVAGTATISAVADYPEFSKHWPVTSDPVSVTWLWTYISSITPGSVAAGSAPTSITVNGPDFLGDAAIFLNGTQVPTQRLSPAALIATVPGGLLANAGVVSVTVKSPALNDQESNVFPLFVTQTAAPVSNVDTKTVDNSQVTASTGPSSTTTPSVQATTDLGTGTVAVAVYDSNPGGTPSFATGTLGGTNGTFVDVYVAPGSTFTSTQIQICDPNGGDVLYWYDTTHSAWVQTEATVTSGPVPPPTCFSLAVTNSTAPSLADLAGTVFAVAYNRAPTTGTITGPTAPVALGTTVSVSVPFDDPDVADSHTVSWDWGDGTTSAATITESNGSGTASGTHRYIGDGTYTITATISDNHGQLATSTLSFVVVYDPTSGGYGLGWFTSPAGTSTGKPQATGRAEFGFAVQYLRLFSKPIGTFEFSFDKAKIDFHGTSIDWMVNTDSSITFRGAGKLGKAAGYGFQVWATTERKGPDKIRIRIWKTSDGSLIYDSEPSAPANPTIKLGGGKIAIKD